MQEPQPQMAVAGLSLPAKHAPPMDISLLERKIKALTDSSPSLFSSSLAGGPSKTINSSLLSASQSLGQSLSLCPKIPQSSPPLTHGVPSCETSLSQVLNQLTTAQTSLPNSTPAAWLAQNKPASLEKVTNNLYFIGQPVPA